MSAKSKGARALETLKRMRSKASEKASIVTQTALVVGGGAVAGYVDERFGEGGEGLQVGGIPVMPVAGLVMIAAGVTDMAGKSSEPVTALGSGIVTAWVASKAAGIGRSAKEKGNIFGSVEMNQLGRGVPQYSDYSVISGQGQYATY